MYFNVTKLFTALLALGGTILPAKGGLIPPNSNVLSLYDEKSSYDDIAKRGLGSILKRPLSKSPSPPLGGLSKRPKLGSPAAGGSAPVAAGHSTARRPIDFENSSYKAEPVEDGPETLYMVYRKDSVEGDDPVDVISVNHGENRLTIMDAQNEADQVRGNSPLTFSEIQMGVWAQAGKTPTDLQTVRYHDIQNDDLVEALRDVRKTLKQNLFTLKATETDEKRRAAFNRLTSADGVGEEGNGLTGSLQKIIREYGVGKRPVEVRVFRDDKSGNVRVMDVDLE